MVLSVLLILIGSTVGAQEHPPPKSVLAIFIFKQGLPWSYHLERSLRTNLASEPSATIELDVEHTDLSRYPEETYIDKVVDLYQYKYAAQKIDLVLAVGDESTELLVNYGEELFGDTPVVLVTSEAAMVPRNLQKPNMTPLMWGWDTKNTIAIIRDLLPQAKHLFVVSGTSKMDLTVRETAYKALRNSDDGFNIQYLIDFDASELIEEVGHLPEDSAILYLSVFRDAAGKAFVPRDYMALISKRANAPVFGLGDTLMGHGVVGGSLVSAENHGEKLAEIAVKLLRGESSKNLLWKGKNTSPMFDWRQLKRWSIDEKRLPPGSIVKYKEVTAWDKYRSQIIGAVALVLIQTAIIFHLLHQRSVRRRAEHEAVLAQRKYRTIADYTYDWEYWQSADGSFLWMSPSCERISGYLEADFIQNPALLLDIILSSDKEVWLEHGCGDGPAGDSKGIQFRIRTRDDTIRWIEHVCQPVFDSGDEIVGVRASNRDITKRKRSEAFLKASREEAGLLAGKLLNAQESERALIARELHDDITQRLAVLNIEVDSIEMGNQTLPGAVKRHLRQISTSLGALSSDIHMISRQLHPSILFDLGLHKAIENECSNFARLRGLSPELDLDNKMTDVPKEIALCIFRILQEGLRNIGKHSDARNIQIKLYQESGSVHFILKDDGKGFDLEKAKAKKGIGLASMVERAYLVNGNLSIESQPGQGTVIEMKVVFTTEENHAENSSPFSG